MFALAISNGYITNGKLWFWWFIDAISADLGVSWVGLIVAAL